MQKELRAKDKLKPAKKVHRLHPIVKKGNIPRHIAIIMDGNGRWAKQRGLPRVAGHRAGVNSVRDAVELCGEMGGELMAGPALP